MDVFTYPKDGAWTVRVTDGYGYWEYYTTMGFYEARLLCDNTQTKVRDRRFYPTQSIDWHYAKEES